MRVPKKSTATYKNAHFFLPAHSILSAHSIFPIFSAFSALPLVSLVSLVSLVPQSPVRLALPLVPFVSLVPLVPLVSLVPPVSQSPVRLALPPVPIFLTLPAFSALSEKFSSIPSLYFRYRKDTRSPKDYRKMSEVQTPNHRLKTRKISYASPIHNLFSNFSFLQAFLAFLFLPLTKKIPSYC